MVRTHTATSSRMLRGEGDYVKAFDIDCAPLNADPKEEVYLALPTVWRAGGKSPVRRLVYALYGLPISRRAWRKRCAAFVKRVGWEQRMHELSLWRRASRAVSGRVVKFSFALPISSSRGPVAKRPSRLWPKS